MAHSSPLFTTILVEYRQLIPFASFPFAVSNIRGKYFVSRFAVCDEFPRLFVVLLCVMSVWYNFVLFLCSVCITRMKNDFFSR